MQSYAVGFGRHAECLARLVILPRRIISRWPGSWLDARLVCSGITSQVPDQLAVVLEVEHRQGLDRPENQDLVAPEVGSQEHVAHPGLDDGPGVALALAQHDFDPAPGHSAVPSQISQRFAGAMPGRRTESTEARRGRKAAACSRCHGMPERAEVDDRIGQLGRELPRVLPPVAASIP